MFSLAFSPSPPSLPPSLACSLSKLLPPRVHPSLVVPPSNAPRNEKRFVKNVSASSRWRGSSGRLSFSLSPFSRSSVLCTCMCVRARARVRRVTYRGVAVRMFLERDQTNSDAARNDFIRSIGWWYSRRVVRIMDRWDSTEKRNAGNLIYIIISFVSIRSIREEVYVYLRDLDNSLEDIGYELYKVEWTIKTWCKAMDGNRWNSGNGSYSWEREKFP